MIALGAALFGARAIWTVAVRGYVLQPDTFLYANGHAWWSSPIAAAFGRVDGYQGEQLLGVAGAIALGAAVARDARTWIAFAPVGLLYLLPLGYAGWCASPDAAGAAAVAAFYRLRGRAAFVAVEATSLLHLEAGLVLAAVLLLQRPLWRLSPALVGVAAGVAACAGEWDVQPRYLLPGCAIATCELVRRIESRSYRFPLELAA